MKNIDDIKRKLQGILAKAEDGAGCTEEEAQGALEFARRLMLRHHLTEADLGTKKDRTPSEIAADTEYGTRDAYTASAKLASWEWQLACAVNILIGTTNAYRGRVADKRTLSGNLEFDANGQSKKATVLTFYGPEADCRDARVIFDEWSVIIAALARMKFGGAFRGEGRSYAEGFAIGLYQKVNDIKRRERQSIDAAFGKQISMGDAAIVANAETENGSNCSALVIVGANQIIAAKKERAESWLRNEKGVKLSRSSSRAGGQHHHGAFESGKSDGRNANFTRTQQGRISQ